MLLKTVTEQLAIVCRRKALNSEDFSEPMRPVSVTPSLEVGARDPYEEALPDPMGPIHPSLAAKLAEAERPKVPPSQVYEKVLYFAAEFGTYPVNHFA